MELETQNKYEPKKYYMNKCHKYIMDVFVKSITCKLIRDATYLNVKRNIQKNSFNQLFLTCESMWKLI